MIHGELQNIAEKQFGLVTREQARTVGLSDRQWSRLNSSGIFVRRHTGVSGLFGFPNSREQRMMAATLALDGRGIASHRSAAELWGVWTPADDDPVDIIISQRASGRELSGVVTHRPRDHNDLAPIRKMGIRSTTASRTLLDLGAVVPSAVPSVTERLLIAGHVTREHLQRALVRHSQRGRDGVGPLREVLASWPYSDRPADSVFELRMDRVLKKYGLPIHETQINVGRYRIDFGWPDLKVAGELDGWGKYERLEQFRRQARRDAFLQINGWIVVHFTWREVIRSERKVIRELEQALRSRGWTPPI